MASINGYDELSLFLQIYKEKDSSIDITYEKLNGLSNTIYLINMESKTSKTTEKFVYKKFGEMSGFVERDLEYYVIDYLSIHGKAPKILRTDGKTFRIEEYIKNNGNFEFSDLTKDEHVGKLFSSLIVLHSLTNFFSYEMMKDGNFKYIPQTELSNKYYPSYSLLDVIFNTMYDKASFFFTKFSKIFEICYSIQSKEFKMFDAVRSYFSRIKDHIIEMNSGLEGGLLVLSHNDLHKLNILKLEDNSMMLIDFETLRLNFLGSDFVNFIIESWFNYNVKTYPFSFFSNENFDPLRYFEMYKNFIEMFRSENESFFMKNEQFLQMALQKKYFLNLVKLISINMIMYSLINLDFDVYQEKDSFDYLQHAYDRLWIILKIDKEL